MAAGKKISSEIAEIVVRMTVLRFHPHVISAITQVSTRSIERIMAHFRRTGSVPDTAKKRPATVKRILTTEHRLASHTYTHLLHPLTPFTVSMPNCEGTPRHIPFRTTRQINHSLRC